IQDPKSPAKERASYTKIVEQVTRTLAVIQDPKLPAKERASYTKIVEQVTRTLAVIQDPKMPAKDRASYTKILEKITTTLVILPDPKMPPKGRHEVEKILERMCDALEIIYAPETPQKARVALLKGELGSQYLDPKTGRLEFRNLPPGMQRPSQKPKGSIEFKHLPDVDYPVNITPSPSALEAVEAAWTVYLGFQCAVAVTPTVALVLTGPATWTLVAYSLIPAVPFCTPLVEHIGTTYLEEYFN
ncbi:hypothetical protein ACIRDZ_38065, partial [Streptomyces swartbergensis]